MPIDNAYRHGFLDGLAEAAKIADGWDFGQIIAKEIRELIEREIAKAESA